MLLDQFKTQVLLLHSEQSTLDSLSSGFGDSYTVHCATSGSEALNYLGDTPIHVIVSAQDLPGMSGAEALREAKKRSPDTIGILLASGEQAVVGEEELFQVIRGEVTADIITRMIDQATQQVRLMALAESANDTAANVDSHTSEHIVMETADNGAAMISDGTGTMPALDPDKVSAAASVGSRSVDVLVLTQDEEFLSTVRESTRGLHNVLHANTPSQADRVVKDNNIGVAVVDAAMVGSKVEKMTLHLRKTKPRLVSIVAGRRDDGEMLMDLINRGKVYRFLLKPVSPGRARLAIEASIKHHLEAPDAAFKITAAPPKASVKAPAKAAPKPVEKPKPVKKKKADANLSAVPDAAKAKAKPASKVRVEPRIGQDSAVADGLSDAFGEDDSKFTETMTGIVTSVGKSISNIKDSLGDGTQSKADADSSGSGGSLFSNPKIIGAGAAVVVIVAAGLFFAFSGSDESTEAAPQRAAVEPAVTESEAAVEAPPQFETSTSAAELLDEARLARGAGQIYNPPGSNAIELYAEAAAAAPGDAVIAAEFDDVVGQALGMAEAALLESNTVEATAALDRVSLVEPGNARLPFLTAQLTQMQARDYLENARMAIRDTRFEDAAASINAARALIGVDVAAIDAVAEELNAVRNEQQVDEVLALANARLDEGALLEPANDNARYYFELALGNDPGSAAARQGLSVVAGKLVLSARSQIDAGQFDAAESLLAEAQQVDPSSAEVSGAFAALKDARDRIADQAAAAQRAAAEKARLERERSELAAAAAKAEQEAAEARKIAEQAAALTAAQALTEEAASSPAGAAGTDPGEDKSAATAQQALVEEPPAEEARPIPVSEQTPVAVSALNRTKYVAPRYPRSAERRSLSGWVDIVFTVTTDGSVTDILVRGSEPGETFVNAAIKAVEKWQFEPVTQDGAVIEKRAGVRLMFAIQ